jgi:hypothetical protein
MLVYSDRQRHGQRTTPRRSYAIRTDLADRTKERRRAAAIRPERETAPVDCGGFLCADWKAHRQRSRLPPDNQVDQGHRELQTIPGSASHRKTNVHGQREENNISGSSDGLRSRDCDGVASRTKAQQCGNVASFDTDGSMIAVDNRCSACILDNPAHFVGKSTPRLKTIKGFHG